MMIFAIGFNTSAFSGLLRKSNVVSMYFTFTIIIWVIAYPSLATVFIENR
jgi:hypothetical protein